MSVFTSISSVSTPGFSRVASGILLPESFRSEAAKRLPKAKSKDLEPTCVLKSYEIEVSFVIRRRDAESMLGLSEHPAYPVAQRYFYNKDLPVIVDVLHENGVLDFNWNNRPFEISQGRRRRTTFPTEYHRSLTFKGKDELNKGKPQVEILQTNQTRRLLRPFSDRGAITKNRTLYQEDGSATVQFFGADGQRHNAYIAVDEFTRAGRGKDFGKLEKGPFVKLEVEFDTVEARDAFVRGDHRFDWILDRGIISNADSEPLRQFKNRYVAKHGSGRERKQDLKALKKEILPKAA